jgi:ribonuclease PH
VDFKKLGEQTIILDCDVIQADGGTRVSSICGAWVALAIAIGRARKGGSMANDPLVRSVAAVSVGMRNGVHLLDLDYDEDSTCDVDMNVVMTGDGGLVEVQGTGEKNVFAKKDLDTMLDLGAAGIAKITSLQKLAVEKALR